MARVLVLGAGFAGIAAARDLARRGHDVTLVDERESFTMGLVNLWALDGRTDGAAHARPLRALERAGLRVVRASVQRIDPDARAVATSAGELRYDKLLVALGAATRVPEGWQGGHDLYSLAGARAFGERLASMRAGRVLVLAHSMPFKCPPAPYEAAMLAKARAPQADVTVATPEPHPIPVFGPEAGAQLRALVESQGVVVRNGVTVQGVSDGVARLADGTELGFDLLGVVPQHAPPAPVAALAGGWLEVDARTMRTRFPDVWAAGDCAMLKLPNGKPIPKAGVLAEGQGLAAAADIHGEGGAFEGLGTCWIETGHGLAAEGNGRFFATPAPTMRISPPSADGMARKEAFERERLAAWFG